MTELPAEGVDVVIWGAGIAGSRLAATLALRGVSVAVVPCGPASYEIPPGFAVFDDEIATRAGVQRRLLDEAAQHGALVFPGDSVSGLSPALGAVRTVLTDKRSIETKLLVLADGSDPRIGRARGVLPEWEPWQLVHFAYQRMDANTESGARVVSGSRQGRAWRGYLATTSDGPKIGVGWYLQHEMDTHIHVTELLDDAQTSLDVRGRRVDDHEVEVIPYESRRIAAPLCADNILAVGDLAGIINPLSLRRAFFSLKMADEAVRLVEQLIQRGYSASFDRKQVQAAFRQFAGYSTQRDAGPPMPDVPRPDERSGGLGKLLQRLTDRSLIRN